MTPNKQTRPGGNRTGQKVAWTAADSLPDAAPDGTDARCLLCARRITAPESIAHGYGPVCWTRVATRQRHERAEALHGRLRGPLRRLPSLDVAGLAVVSAALDDAVDALDRIGGTR